MASVSESSADLTAVTGEDASSSFERKVPCGNVSSTAGAVQNETETSTTPTSAGQDGKLM